MQLHFEKSKAFLGSCSPTVLLLQNLVPASRQNCDIFKNIILNFVSYRLAVPQSTAMLTAIDLDLRQQPIAIEVEQHRQQQIVVQSVKTDQLLDNVPNYLLGASSKSQKMSLDFLELWKNHPKWQNTKKERRKTLLNYILLVHRFSGTQLYHY